MRSGRRLAGGLASLVLLSGAGAQASPVRSAPGVSAGKRATMRTFAGRWYGHTRGLTVTRRGRARETIFDGCCDHVIDLRFRLRHPHGTTTHAKARARVTSVRVYDKRAFTKQHPAPHVGQTGTVKLRHGVIHDPFTSTTYCTLEQQMKGTCGA